MATMPKSSGLSEMLRGGAGIYSPDGSGQAATNAAQAWFAATAECQREMMSFVSKRLEKDAATSREMMACKNLADIAAVQSRWLEETLRDYNAEMGKLMTICTNSINGGASPKG